MAVLGLAYLAIAIYGGDQLCRRFYRFVSLYHRWAAATLVGLLLTSWFTYLTAWAFAATNRPLLWADILFFTLSICAIALLLRRGRKTRAVLIEPRVPGSPFWDWIILGIYFLAACWLMFATLDYKQGKLCIANNEWSDFGPNTAIARSFSVGHNFPTQYPHFTGESIRYHFLFYFQAGNLEFLGLNLAWSINILSILGLVCMLALIMALGQLLFNSRTVARIGSALFFFHGTLSFIPFLRVQRSLGAALHSIVALKEFLPSGYPYRGEQWGIWTQIVFLNQRHLASAIGILTVVLIFLVDRYRQRHCETELAPRRSTEPVTSASGPSGEEPPEAELAVHSPTESNLRRKIGPILKTMATPSFLFSGFLLGALPFWNALVFTAAFALLASLFFLFPCRGSMLGLGATAAVVAFPQIHYLRSGGLKTPLRSLIHWGYVIENPTVAKIIEYVGFAFGTKWLLIVFAFTLASRLQRRFFLATCSLLLITFCTQFSVEALANHKFLNIWLILANLFVAYGLYRLWNLRIRAGAVPGQVAALLLLAPIVLGGIIDLFPIHNGYFVEIAYAKDPLVEWVRANTKPHDVFLSDRFVNHQILLAGRRIFYGWPSYAWSAGYDTGNRDMAYREMFESRDPARLFTLLHQNHIAYVAFDNGVRHGEFIRHPNEHVYADNFPKVYEDKTGKYASLTIYKVPDTAPAEFHTRKESSGVSMFQGGKGTGNGEFDFPRGLAADASGNILISDTNNGRIQMFTPSGVFMRVLGQMGQDEGDFDRPDGIALDKEGYLYVADTGNQRVQKLKTDGTFVAQWKGPSPGLYGPRDVAVGADNSIYVVDQGHGRIIRFNGNGQVLAVWGSTGTADGQFAEPTGVAIDGETGRVYVADPRTQRIEVLDSNGNFIKKWLVNEWKPNPWVFQHLVIDSARNRLYASSLATDEVLVFDLDGRKVGSLKPAPPEKLAGASAMAIVNGKLYVLCTFANRVSQIDLSTVP